MVKEQGQNMFDFWLQQLHFSRHDVQVRGDTVFAANTGCSPSRKTK